MALAPQRSLAMSEANNIPDPGATGGPASRPSGEGLPPQAGGEHRPAGGPEDSVDTGIDIEGDRGEDTGGMIGEG
jgi:hypothetical protein